MTETELLTLLRNAGLNLSSGSTGGTPASGSDMNTIQQPGTGTQAGGGVYGPPDPSINPMEFFLRSTPGYQFAFGEGQRAVQTGAASRGTLLTGGTLKALNRYGTGIADQTYNQAVSHRLSLADIGARTATAPF